MRVSTRIISGFGSLMILAFIAVIYQVYVINQMQSINTELSSVNFRGAEIVLQMKEEARAVDRFSGYYFASPSNRDSYAEDLRRWSALFEDHISELQNSLSSEDERMEARRLADAWQNYRIQWNLELSRELLPEGEDLPSTLVQRIEAVHFTTNQVYEAIQTSIRQRVAQAAAMGASAQQFSWAAGVLAALIAAVLVYALHRAITDPLRQLTKGTRLVTQGQFWHRLPADGKDEFAELARAFNAMNQRLGELDQMKKDFVSHVSHELKAPLASIRQTFLLLLQQIPGPLTEQQRRLIRLSSNSAERLAAMVGNLLDVSRMEAGTMEYAVAPTDLLSLARSIADEFEVQSNDKGITIRVEAEAGDSFLVACDRDRMSQVIGNLFDNALKFSQRGGEIVVKIKEQTEGSDRVFVFCVSDSGPGIPDAHKNKVFQKFHQVKHGKKLTGQGVGLGLAICRSIVEGHQGQIWVEDNPAGGSVFCFKLHAATKVAATVCN